MMDLGGKPLADCTVTAEHKLWWPMTEALYALMHAIELTGDLERWLPWLQKVHRWIYGHLCDASGGGEWFGYLRRDGSVFNACKGGVRAPVPMRVSGPMHVHAFQPPSNPVLTHTSTVSLVRSLCFSVLSGPPDTAQNYKGFFHVPRGLLMSLRSAERYLSSAPSESAS